MTVDNTTEPAVSRTLVEAHEAVARIRPGRQAPPDEWLSYHQRAAAVYTEVAEIDRGHHHESLYWADREREHARKIKVQIRTSDDA
jgi:hypothetical protein